MDARKVALECLLNLSEADASITFVVDAVVEKHRLNGRERRLTNALVYGVVRWQQQLDWVLAHFVNPSFQLDTKRRMILRLGAFQLLHLDGIPARAAINETVHLVSEGRKTKGFVNAVLRSIQREGKDLSYPQIESNPIDHIAFSYSYPKWLVKRWIQLHGFPWTLSFCKASNQIAPLSLRTNSLITNPEKLQETLSANGLTTRISNLAPEGLVVENRSITTYDDISSTTGNKTLKDVLTREDIYVQDESAMLVPYLLMSESPKLVVDLCAAPGGKTTHIACMMENSGKVIAVDTSAEKLMKLKQNCRRLGIKNVETRSLDVANSVLSIIKSADAVLLDVPCSGFGTIRRHPDIRWNKTSKQLQSLPLLQYRLLVNAAKYIRRDGILVYSTCTIEQSENEGVVNRFLKNHPMFSVEHADKSLPEISQSVITPEGYIKTSPHEHGVDGAFAVKLRKTADNQ